MFYTALNVSFETDNEYGKDRIRTDTEAHTDTLFYDVEVHTRGEPCVTTHIMAGWGMSADRLGDDEGLFELSVGPAAPEVHLLQMLLYAPDAGEYSVETTNRLTGTTIQDFSPTGLGGFLAKFAAEAGYDVRMFLDGDRTDYRRHAPSETPLN